MQKILCLRSLLSLCHKYFGTSLSAQEAITDSHKCQLLINKKAREKKRKRTNFSSKRSVAISEFVESVWVRVPVAHIVIVTLDAHKIVQKQHANEDQAGAQICPSQCPPTRHLASIKTNTNDPLFSPQKTYYHTYGHCS